MTTARTVAVSRPVFFIILILLLLLVLLLDDLDCEWSVSWPSTPKPPKKAKGWSAEKARVCS
jgi:hypothetical protein